MGVVERSQNAKEVHHTAGRAVIQVLHGVQCRPARRIHVRERPRLRFLDKPEKMPQEIEYSGRRYIYTHTEDFAQSGGKQIRLEPRSK